MRNLLPFLVLMAFACSHPQVIVYETLDGDSFSQATIDSLKKIGYIIHLLDSSKTDDSIVYSTYYYHESAQYMDLQKRHTGRQLPKFTLIDYEGATISSASLQGKPMMINCWSVICKPCIVEMPELNKLKEKYKNHVQFVAISLEDKQAVSKILHKREFDFLKIVDGETYLNEIGIRLFPTSFFVDRGGNIVDVLEGTPVTIGDDGQEENIDGTLLEKYSLMIERLLNKEGE